MAMFCTYLGIGLVPAALGLFVGLLALGAYRYLTNRLEAFDLEMLSVSVDRDGRCSMGNLVRRDHKYLSGVQQRL